MNQLNCLNGLRIINRLLHKSGDISGNIDTSNSTASKRSRKYTAGYTRRPVEPLSLVPIQTIHFPW